MTSRPWATAVTAVAVSLALVGASGCGSTPLGGTPGKDIQVLPDSTVPHQLNGLTVKPERVTKALKKARHAYVDAVGFYSLRHERVVQGTIEVARFGPGARLSDKSFRQRIVTDVSPGTPIDVNVGSSIVFQSAGTKSTVDIWFSKGRMVILTVLDTYTGGRGLLEQTLAALPAT